MDLNDYHQDPWDSCPWVSNVHLDAHTQSISITFKVEPLIVDSDLQADYVALLHLVRRYETSNTLTLLYRTY